MQLYNSGREYRKNGGSVLALGSFDTLHIAHQKLICEAVLQAKKRGVRCGVHLFDRRPETVICGSDCKSIYQNEDRAKIIESLGADFAYFETFDEKFMRIDSRGFTQYLKDKFDVVCVVAGFHYTFGYKGEGDADKLRRYGARFGFDVVILEPVMQDNHLVSSTLVRECIKRGDICAANRLIGRNYAISGTVMRDRGVGTKMKIPTANLELTGNLLLPKNGVYATYSCINGCEYAGVTNIGVRPTFSLDKVAAETHLIGFDGSIYGEKLNINFIERLRDEKKFDTKEELAKQIFGDIDKAKRLFLENKGWNEKKPIYF